MRHTNKNKEIVRKIQRTNIKRLRERDRHTEIKALRGERKNNTHCEKETTYKSEMVGRFTQKD